MKNKGYTLIEVILSIFLIGLISISFIPSVASGYRNIVNSQRLTKEIFDNQKDIENRIEYAKKIDPNFVDPSDPSFDIKTIEVFSKNIKGHNVKIDIGNGRNISAFVPETQVNPAIPVISSRPEIDIRKNGVNLSPTPTGIDILSDQHTLFVNEITITNSTKDDYLMSIYRWYVSNEIDNIFPAPSSLNDYFVLKEWNEAKKQLSFEESQDLKFIPNIKDSYNTVDFRNIQESLFYDDDVTLINTLGNRYIMYGVTPYAISGHIGKEEISNPIYIEAPKIEIDKALFISSNQIGIYFINPIQDNVDKTKISLNDSIGTPNAAYRDSDNEKLLILDFDEDIDTSKPVSGNKLYKGSVQSPLYGIISIWSNNEAKGEFTIYDVEPIKITDISITGAPSIITIGNPLQLNINITPSDATNKNLQWSSSNPDILSVDENGIIEAYQEGNVTITASSTDGSNKSASINILVLPLWLA